MVGSRAPWRTVFPSAFDTVTVSCLKRTSKLFSQKTLTETSGIDMSSNLSHFVAATGRSLRSSWSVAPEAMVVSLAQLTKTAFLGAVSWWLVPRYFIGRKCPVAPESKAPCSGRRSHRALHAQSAAVCLGGGDTSRVVSNWTCLGVSFGLDLRQVWRGGSLVGSHGY